MQTFKQKRRLVKAVSGKVGNKYKQQYMKDEEILNYKRLN